jgi:acyl-CoA synthetase (NDP forming)
VNTDPLVGLSAVFASAGRVPGPLALASQSGAVGINVLDAAEAAGLGTAAFVSLGNKIDVSSNDLLLYWGADPRVRVIALYLESFGNPRKLARIARHVSASTPVLAVKAVRTASGRRAGQSHTAAATTPDTAVDALFAACGILRLDTVSEMVDAARLLAGQPLPAGGRLAIVGNAGGAGILAADAAGPAGLRVPRLSDGLREELDRLAPSAASTDNPVDLGAAATPEAFAATLRAVLASGEADAVLAVFAATRTQDAAAVVDALTAAAGTAGGATLACSLLGLRPRPPVLVQPGEGRVPVYDFPETAVRALGVAVRAGRWRRSPRGRLPDLSGIDVAAARRGVVEWLERNPRGGWLDAGSAAALLGDFGIAVVRTVAAQDAAAAVRAARSLGYPVAVKSADPALVHKTELGGVQVNLRDDDEVWRAHAIAAAAGDASAGVLVQRMHRAEVELVVGVTADPTFGPVVLLGLGGVTTDLLGDRAFRLAPLTDLDAAGLCRELRASPLLFGYRGRPPADVPALEDLLLRVGRLADELPELAELDLNPVMLDVVGLSVVDVKLRLAPAPARSDPMLRALRDPG